MTLWLTILLAILPQLIAWLLKRPTLTDGQRTKLARVMGLCRKVGDAGRDLGVEPE